MSLLERIANSKGSPERAKRAARLNAGLRLCNVISASNASNRGSLSARLRKHKSASKRGTSIGSACRPNWDAWQVR